MTQTHQLLDLIAAQASQPKVMPQSLPPSDLTNQLTHILCSGDPQTVLSTVACVLQQAFEADSCLLMVRESKSPASTNEARSQIKLYGYPTQAQTIVSSLKTEQLELCAVEDQLNHSEILAISDVATAERNNCKINLWSVLKVRAVLGTATQFQGQVNGGIVVMRSQPYSWTDSDRNLLKTVNDQVAIAISQILQAQGIESLQKQVIAYTQHRNLVHQLTMAIHHALDLPNLLQLAIDGMVQTLQVHQGFILLLKYGDPLFATRAGIGQAKRLPKAKVTIVCQSSGSTPAATTQTPGEEKSESLVNQSFWLSDCVLCTSAFTSSPKPLVLVDKRKFFTEDSDNALAPIFQGEEMPALLLVPLVGVPAGTHSSGTVLGFMVLQHSCPRTWSEDELELVELVSTQVSTAIIHSQTMQQIQALVDERTSQLQRSLDVQAKLYEKTRQQVEQLRRLNQLKDEFLATIGHELRTPLATMTLAIEMLRKPGFPEERRQKYLDILEQECRQETELIQDLLRLQKLESNQADLQLEKVDLKDLVNSLVDSYRSNWEEKGLKLSVNLPKRALKLETDKDSLNRILEELLTNAGKYSEPGSTVVLQAVPQGEPSHSQIILMISNTGKGISPEEMPYIFDKFRRGQGVTQQAIAGTGLGLALVKCLTQHLNGNITVTSEPKDGTSGWETCFTLTLPLVFNPSKI
jgi:signal transduction histidine kinase